jgi:hypothetical protein
MLTKREWECGSMQELSMSGPRRIPEWNVSPPEGQGTGQELNADLQGAFKAMLKPIEAKLDSEKGAGSKL